MTETTCPPGCGLCCDPVTLRFTVADMDGPSAAFAREHWRDVSDEYEFAPGTDIKSAVRCDMFNPVTRACTAYEQRPPICSGYPWYGQQPDRARLLHPSCAYQADGRPLLPIVAVTHGR